MPKHDILDILAAAVFHAMNFPRVDDDRVAAAEHDRFAGHDDLGLAGDDDENLLHVLVVMGREAVARRQSGPIDHLHRAGLQLVAPKEDLFPHPGASGFSWLAGMNVLSAARIIFMRIVYALDCTQVKRGAGEED